MQGPYIDAGSESDMAAQMLPTNETNTGHQGISLILVDGWLVHTNAPRLTEETVDKRHTTATNQSGTHGAQKRLPSGH